MLRFFLYWVRTDILWSLTQLLFQNYHIHIKDLQFSHYFSYKIFLMLYSPLLRKNSKAVFNTDFSGLFSLVNLCFLVNKSTALLNEQHSAFIFKYFDIIRRVENGSIYLIRTTPTHRGNFNDFGWG